jgi:hypothetical protein
MKLTTTVGIVLLLRGTMFASIHTFRRLSVGFLTMLCRFESGDRKGGVLIPP